MNEASKKKYLIIGGILIVVVLLVFGGITLLSPKPTSTNVTSNVSKTSSSVTSNALSSTPSDSPDESTNYVETTIKIGSSNNKLPSVTLSDNPIVAKASTSSSSSSSEESVTSSSSSSSTSSTVSLVSNPIDLGTKTPANILVTNKDYKRWSVVWTTSIATVGKLKVTAPGLNKTYSDDRTEFATTKSFTHHVTVTSADDLLSSGNPTFTYIILVDGEEAGSYTYVNAPLLSSPSSPTTAVLKLNPASKSKDIILTGRIKTGSTYSDYLSCIIDSSSSSSMVIGIARSTALSQYVSLSSPNTLEVTAYGNTGKSIGSKTGITLANIDESIVTLNVTLASSQIASSSSSRASTSSTGTGTTVPNTAISGTDELIYILSLALLILGISVYELGRFGMRSKFEKKVISDV